MYSLYHSKSKGELVIAPAKNLLIKAGEVPKNEVVSYNDCIFICTNRKLLREKAKELLEAWISEYELELEKLKNTKIKNKY